MISFLPDARAELDDAAAWYDTQCRGLGLEFVGEVFRGIDRIEEFPDAHQTIYSDIKRCILRRFPYAVVFRSTGKNNLIIAVMHMHRDPDYWKSRVS